MRIGSRAAQLHRLMFEQMMALELSEAALAVAKSSFDCLVTRVADAAAAGELAVGERVEDAQLIWGATHGAVSLEIANVHFAQDRAMSFAPMPITLLIGMGASRESFAEADR